MGDAVTSLLGGGALGAATSGALGKQSLPGVPDFSKAAIDTSNASRYNTSGPNGSVSWTLRPGADPANPQVGDYIQTTSLSPGQQGLYDSGLANQNLQASAAGQQLGALNTGPQAIGDAIYNKQTQYLGQNFGDQTNALETQLQNQGLTEGSDAYDRALRNLRQTQDSAYTTAADNATIGADSAQNNMVSRIAALMAGSKATLPNANNVGTSPDLLSALKDAYSAQTGNVNAQNAQTGQTAGQLGQLASAAMMAFL